MKRIVSITLIASLLLPSVSLALDYVMGAVKSTAWTAFNVTYKPEFNAGRGNPSGFDSMNYAVYTNSSGAEYLHLSKMAVHRWRALGCIGSRCLNERHTGPFNKYRIRT